MVKLTTDYAVVEVEPRESKTNDGLFMTYKNVNTYQQDYIGRVKAIGPGRKSRKNPARRMYQSPDLKEGCRILFNKNTMIDAKNQYGKDHWYVRYDSIIAIIGDDTHVTSIRS